MNMPNFCFKINTKIYREKISILKSNGVLEYSTSGFFLTQFSPSVANYFGQETKNEGILGFDRTLQI